VVNNLTATDPGVAAVALTIKADGAVVDGEIVALDAAGRPSLQALQHRGSKATRSCFTPSICCILTVKT
jgi:ATP-dependent DNA ligase